MACELVIPHLDGSLPGISSIEGCSIGTAARAAEFAPTHVGRPCSIISSGSRCRSTHSRLFGQRSGKLQVVSPSWRIGSSEHTWRYKTILTQRSEGVNIQCFVHYVDAMLAMYKHHCLGVFPFPLCQVLPKRLIPMLSLPASASLPDSLCP